MILTAKSSETYGESEPFADHTPAMSVGVGKRLAEAREQQGFSQAEVARKLSVSREAVAQWESGDTTPHPKRWAEISKVLKISADIFYKGEVEGVPSFGVPDDWTTKDFAPHSPEVETPEESPEEAEIPPLSQFIKELDISAAAGGGALEERSETDGGPLWHFPTGWMQSEFRAKAPDLRIITIDGDSMLSDPPSRRDLEPGDKVVVNLRDVRPTPPGIFIVWDGLGLIAKRIEFIAHSEPATVRIMSNNSEYSTYERTLDEAHIWGRVVGRWQRF